MVHLSLLLLTARTSFFYKRQKPSIIFGYSMRRRKAWWMKMKNGLGVYSVCMPWKSPGSSKSRKVSAKRAEEWFGSGSDQSEIFFLFLLLASYLQIFLGKKKKKKRKRKKKKRKITAGAAFFSGWLQLHTGEKERQAGIRKLRRSDNVNCLTPFLSFRLPGPLIVETSKIAMNRGQD